MTFYFLLMGLLFLSSAVSYLRDIRRYNKRKEAGRRVLNSQKL
jgi:hypothetical protein